MITRITRTEFVFEDWKDIEGPVSPFTPEAIAALKTSQELHNSLFDIKISYEQVQKAVRFILKVSFKESSREPEFDPPGGPGPFPPTPEKQEEKP